MDYTTQMTGISNDSVRHEDSPFLSFKLSWVAYPRLALGLLLRLVIFGIVGMFIRQLVVWSWAKEWDWIVTLAVLLAMVWVVYDFLYLRSVVLFTDDTGVWMQSGVFAWEKGVSGVKWRDISEATYTTGFVSWALRCYTVRVGHRFTNGAELNLRNLHRGNLAVEHINAVLQRLGGR
jgi:hypothetical protein